MPLHLPSSLALGDHIRHQALGTLVPASDPLGRIWDAGSRMDIQHGTRLPIQRGGEKISILSVRSEEEEDVRGCERMREDESQLSQPWMPSRSTSPHSAELYPPSLPAAIILDFPSLHKILVLGYLPFPSQSYH